MALKPFNSIGGFAVGEGQDLVIDGLQNATLANVDASGNLVVTGESTFTGDVAASGNVVIDVNLDVSGAADVVGALTAGSLGVDTSATIGNALTVSGSANIVGDSVFGANLAITGDVSAVNGSFTGDVDVTGLLDVTGDISGANIALGGLANITGSLFVGGAATLDSTLGVTDAATFDSTVDVTGIATFANSVVIEGALANIVNDATVGGTLGVTGAATFSNTLSVTDQATVGSLVVNNDALVSGNLTVDGNVVYVNVENLTVEDPLIDLGTGANGAVLTSNDGKDRGSLLEYYTTAPVTAFSGWKNSAGEYYIASNVSVAADIVTVNTWSNVRLDTVLGNVSGGYITLTGAATVGGILDVSGAASIDGLLTVANAANITGTVTIGGDANIAGNLNIGGDVQFDDLYATGNLIAAQNVIGARVVANTTMTFGTSITGPTVFANTVVSNVAILADSANAFSSNTAPRVAYTSANVEVPIFTGTTNLNYTFKLVGVDQGNTANRYSVSVDTDWNGDYVVYNTLGTSLGAVGFITDAPNNASYLTVTPNTNNAIAWFNTVTTTTF